MEYPTYAQLKPKLSQSKFRSRFHLTDKDRAYIALKGWVEIRFQARKFITERLSAANPIKDGKQTPMRGHVVFLAQHATACCCRGCLEKWHAISAGHALNDTEIDYIVDFLLDWLKDQAGNLSSYPTTPTLFSDLN